MAVKHGGHRIAIERLFEPARSEVRKNLEWLAFDGRADRCVVKERNAMRGAQSRECRLELERFVDRFLHEELDGRFAPRTERAAAESAGESLRACKANPLNFRGVAVEHLHARVPQRLTNVFVMAGLVV